MKTEWKELDRSEGVILYFDPNSKQFQVNAPEQSFRTEYDDYSKAKAAMTRLINEKLGVKPEKGKEPVPVIVLQYQDTPLFGKATSIQHERYSSTTQIRITTEKEGLKSSRGYSDYDIFADNEKNRSIVNQMTKANTKIDELNSTISELKEKLEKFDPKQLTEF